MLLKTKVEYISSYNEDGAYRKETIEFLLRAETFCDAEKATLSIIKERYHPKEESDIVVTAISTYSVEPDMYQDDEYIDCKWFEIHVKMKELKEDGSPKFKVYKYLKRAIDVTDAERIIASELKSGNLFEDFKVVKVIEMNFKEVIA
jgi:hypothetical protein